MLLEMANGKLFLKAEVSPILVGGVLGNGADPILGSQPVGDSMHGY